MKKLTVMLLSAAVLSLTPATGFAAGASAPAPAAEAIITPEYYCPSWATNSSTYLYFDSSSSFYMPRTGYLNMSGFQAPANGDTLAYVRYEVREAASNTLVGSYTVDGQTSFTKSVYINKIGYYRIVAVSTAGTWVNGYMNATY